MALTDDRWLGARLCTIGGVTVDDIVGASIESGGQLIASTSEGKKFDNAFLDMVKKQRTLTLRTLDVAAAVSLDNTRKGRGTSFSLEIAPSIAQGSSATNINATATSPQAFISRVFIPADQDVESQCEIAVSFKSPDGDSEGLTLA